MDIIVAISYQSLVIVVSLPFLDRVSLFRLIYIQIKCIPFWISGSSEVQPENILQLCPKFCSFIE